MVLLSFLMVLFAFPAAARAAQPAPLYISEFMAANQLTPVEGRACDWVELHNAGETEIDLDGYGLSDNPGRPFKAVLTGVLAPGAYLALPADGEGLGFALSRDGETLALTAPDGRTVHEAAFGAMPDDASLAWDGATFTLTWQPTPGAENRFLSRDGAETLRWQGASERGIFISEVLAASGAYERGKLPHDWVELRNPGLKAVKLHGLYLTDSASDLTKWAFPSGATLRAGDYAAVYCTRDRLPAQGRGVFVNNAFTIDKTGGAVLLTDGETVLDAVSLGAQFGGVSYGRPEGQGAFRFLNGATFRQANPAQGFLERLPAVGFSRAGGFAGAPFLLRLEAPEGAQVRFTLDGSEPDARSALYEAPVEIAKNTVVRAAASMEGFVDSPVSARTFLFDAPPDSPVVCVSGSPAFFFGGDGIFEQKNQDLLIQRRAHLEVYEDGAPRLDQQVSLKLTGGTSRKYLPRTFTVYARPGLGESAFAYNPFPDRAYPEYAAFTLRSGGTDAVRTRLRDGFLTRLTRGYGLMYLAYRPAAVYVNGQFWGMLNFRERANRDAVAQWEGVTDPAAIRDIIIIKNRGVQQQGSREELEALAAFCRTRDLNVPEHLSHVLGQLDVDSLFAHSAFQIITGNGDLQNVRYYKVPGGKWKLMLFDLDLGMMNNNNLTLPFYLGRGKTPTPYCYGELFQALMQVPEMKARFLALTGRILRERFAPADVGAQLDAWQADIAPLIARHAQRWPGFGVKNWEKAMADFRRVLTTRPALVIKYLTASFKLTEAEAARYFGGFPGTGGT